MENKECYVWSLIGVCCDFKVGVLSCEFIIGFLILVLILWNFVSEEKNKREIEVEY